MCFYKGVLIYLNFVIICSEDEIKGMFEEFKLKEFMEDFSEIF